MQKKAKNKVLIIDDNYSILEYLKTVFRRYDFEIKTSMNGYDGLQEVAEFKPDIIFLDLMMPNIDGIQMLQLKKVLNDIKDIPVIVISANAGRSNVMAAIEAGADRVLAKPLNIKQLKSAVDEILGGNFFESEVENDSSNESENEEKENIFIQKYAEQKENLLNAVKKRDAVSVKEVSTHLQEFCGDLADFENLKILSEIELRKYEKPSDWMFVEMKLKEIDQNLKKIVRQL